LFEYSSFDVLNANINAVKKEIAVSIVTIDHKEASNPLFDAPIAVPRNPFDILLSLLSILWSYGDNLYQRNDVTGTST
jgi:hypothetical protein